jgi:hypothetical protein
VKARAEVFIFPLPVSLLLHIRNPSQGEGFFQPCTGKVRDYSASPALPVD